jgi:hypothetical protein
MTVYLDADCALGALVSTGFMKKENWKRRDLKQYTARFYHGTTNGTLCFEVYAEGDIHKISALYIKNLERLYGVKLSLIVDKCAV